MYIDAFLINIIDVTRNHWILTPTSSTAKIRFPIRSDGFCTLSFVMPNLTIRHSTSLSKIDWCLQRRLLRTKGFYIYLVYLCRVQLCLYNGLTHYIDPERKGTISGVNSLLCLISGNARNGVKYIFFVLTLGFIVTVL